MQIKMDQTKSITNLVIDVILMYISFFSIEMYIGINSIVSSVLFGDEIGYIDLFDKFTKFLITILFLLTGVVRFYLLIKKNFHKKDDNDRGGLE